MKEEVMYQGENIKERGKIFIKLLLPVLIYQVISYSSGMIGTFMAGHYSPTDLAGVSMGVNIWNPVMYTLNAIVLAIVPIVSHLIGKKREEEIPVMVRQFLYIAVLISIILVIALNTLAAPIVDSLGMDAKIATITKNYLYYESFGVLSIFFICSIAFIYGQFRINKIVDDYDDNFCTGKCYFSIWIYFW